MSTNPFGYLKERTQYINVQEFLGKFSSPLRRLLFESNNKFLFGQINVIFKMFDLCNIIYAGQIEEFFFCMNRNIEGLMSFVPFSWKFDSDYQIFY